MGNNCYNLKDKRIEFGLGTRSFTNTIKLAHAFGWKPKGTRLDPDRERISKGSGPGAIF